MNSDQLNRQYESLQERLYQERLEEEPEEGDEEAT
jgi:hypothetical protein